MATLICVSILCSYSTFHVADILPKGKVDKILLLSHGGLLESFQNFVIMFIFPEDTDTEV